jgi:hypothetical protein
MVDSVTYNPGEIIEYGTDPTTSMSIAPKAYDGPTEARTLIFSDDPEYVTGPGIMYQDTVMGKFRVFMYHVNNYRKALFFSVLITNPNPYPITVTVSQKAAVGPSADYTAMGKLAIGMWLQSTGGDQINLYPGQTMFLNSLEMPMSARRNELIHYLYDAETTGPIIVSTVARKDKKFSLNGLTILRSAAKGKDTPMRGTFQFAEYNATYFSNLSENGQYADGAAGTTEYLAGWSAVDGRPTVNYGNYGILYHTKVQILPKSTLLAAIVFNSRGGTFATWAKVVVTESSQIIQSGPYAIPTTQPSFGTNTLTQGVMLYKDSFVAGITKFVEVVWMPAGGTNLPVDILVQPYLSEFKVCQ